MNPVKEYEELESLLDSEAWQCFLVLLFDHRSYLEKEKDLCLKKYEDRRAGEYRACAEDVSRIATLVKDRLKDLRELQKEREEGGK